VLYLLLNVNAGVMFQPLEPVKLSAPECAEVCKALLRYLVAQLVEALRFKLEDQIQFLMGSFGFSVDLILLATSLSWG
jgi:hypothetical protein